MEYAVWNHMKINNTKSDYLINRKCKINRNKKYENKKSQMLKKKKKCVGGVRGAVEVERAPATDRESRRETRRRST